MKKLHKKRENERYEKALFCSCHLRGERELREKVMLCNYYNLLLLKKYKATFC